MGLIYYGPKWSWAEMVMGRNGHGPKWLWAEMTRNYFDSEIVRSVSAYFGKTRSEIGYSG